MQETAFNFKRERGIAWVCDIANFSHHLNDDKTAGAIEEFIPRFHWTARMMVEAAGGVFVKWTGDGFLAWFPASLHRDLGQPARMILNAAWHMTFLVNITRLGVDSEKAFRIRHGVVIEQDALVTIIKGVSGQTMDIVGRGIVLAFRLAGVKAAFPAIVTTKEVLELAGDVKRCHFVRWQPNVEEHLKYFKGERWGTTSLCYTSEKKTHRSSLRGVLKNAKKTLNQFENLSKTPTNPDVAFMLEFINRMEAGPTWCKETICAEYHFVRDELAASLKKIVATLEKKNN